GLCVVDDRNRFARQCIAAHARRKMRQMQWKPRHRRFSPHGAEFSCLDAIPVTRRPRSAGPTASLLRALGPTRLVRTKARLATSARMARSRFEAMFHVAGHALAAAQRSQPLRLGNLGSKFLKVVL